MKRLMLVILFLAVVATPVHARQVWRKNLYPLVENGKTLKVYLNDFKSVTENISADQFKQILKDALVARKKENFVVVADKQDADIVVDADLFFYRYLEKDPVDHLAGGTYGLVADVMISQNYIQIKVVFTVTRAKDGRQLWHRKEGVSVTETDMPEEESIPKVLQEASKRFIFLCFGKRGHRL